MSENLLKGEKGMSLSVIEQGKKFVVADNGKPISVSKRDGSTIVTEFDTRQDAEKYISILKTLRKQS